MSDDMSMLYTIAGYIAIFGVGYVAYHYSSQKHQAKAAPVRPAKTQQAEPRKEDRKKKQRMETFASEAQEASKKASKAKEEAKAPDTSAWLSNSNDKDEVDNREFARQLAKAKEGTKFAAKADSGKQREKSVKQSRANKMAGATEDKESAPSSTTGADADDDQSPVTSPEVGPAVAVAGDVSDMLEAAPARPSILRLTDTEEKKKNKKAPKAAAPVETKKQRQNRKKAEAAKAAREEAEKERKVLEEKQRRTARVAEGRAAKDGSQFMAAQAAKSVWKEGAPKAPEAPKTNGFHQPLDTYEQAPANAVNAPKPAGGNWTESLPSEEEQIEMLKDNDDEWSTVKTKSKKASKKAPSVESSDEPSARPAAQPQQPIGNKASKPTQSFGSFSALTNKNDVADEEEEEEEWDV
ncbi:hypothetical protein NCS57_00102600 [Fusarium keratoplasticum]|uniref:Uncharacterized protein n=1 Tax=Fusarium keratoplasticum TaxID=1328300 RepID=A0ACC0RE34_9HYPO|nr:hypothetical protein NCS57_00102600 [Fusarium keratoplasticum]KAI8684366.1 hypothetical protein NCS57_00102600 [Fusarium keratoplasticum]KAI8688479.1 hypothetical protein NCS55_00101700 [Fusarium keratoplasticum]